MKKLTLMFITTFILATFPIAYSINILHEFEGGSGDGGHPYGGLAIDSDKFYGMTSGGGSSGNGVIFSINKEGTGFDILYEFSGYPGAYIPRGRPVIDSGKIYGMTQFGGNDDMGTIFSISNSGTDFTILHEFEGGSSDGRNPYGSLAIDSDKLYGMTRNGGSQDKGVIFSINTNGTGFDLLHSFSGGGGNFDGSNPYGSLAIDSDKLYGMTSEGGTNNLGMIFYMNTNGTDFTHRLSFSGLSSGSMPYGDLVLLSGKLYGMAQYGGDNNNGALFYRDADDGGVGFDVLHDFGSFTNDGTSPSGSLIYESGKFYGMTSTGGSSDKGIIFSIDSDGSDYTILHEFEGGDSDGASPWYNRLLLDSGKLYGMTSNGGTGGDRGVIFSLPNYPLVEPNITEFISSPDTTNFSIVSDLTNVTNLTLATGYGKINFPIDYGINSNNEDYDSNVVIDDGLVFVNSSALHQSFNNTATLTFNNVDCSKPYVYYSETESTFAGILAENQICTAPLCTNIQCSSGTLAVDVAHFTGYAAGTLANLTIQADAGTYYENESVPFFASYINSTDGTPISGECNISFDDNWGTWFEMDYNGSQYNYSKSFLAGLHDYNVTCYNSSFNTLEANDSKSINSLITPNITEFISSPDTTNFSIVSDLTNVTNLTLATGYGKINFPIDYGINSNNEDYDSNVVIDDGLVFVNSSALHQSFNNTATLTFNNVDCSKPYVYYSETESTFAGILAENQICTAPLCTNIQCSSGTLAVDVAHFTGYAAGTLANLTIQADAGTYYENESVPFFASYINSTDGTPISGECNISFDDNWGTWFEMDYNGSQYNYSKSFLAGLHDYNVTCYNSSFNTLEANDSKYITPISPDVPEFSLLTLGIGLAVILAGLVITRWKK